MTLVKEADRIGSSVCNMLAHSRHLFIALPISKAAFLQILNSNIRNEGRGNMVLQELSPKTPI